MRATDASTRRRRRRLRGELADAAIAVPSDRFLADALIAELDYARFPPVHEGALPTYGSIVVCNPVDVSGPDATVTTLDPDDRAVLRLLADGRHSFALRRPRHLELLLLEEAHDREAALVELRDRFGPERTAIVHRHGNGLVRLLTETGISVWDGAHWWAKPYASRFARNVLAACPEAQDGPLQDVLHFCVHTMSPADAGATLVWTLGAQQLADVAGLSASREPTAVPSLSFSGRATRSAIRQLLSQVDGAGIVNSDGRLIAIGAQLRSSAESHETLRIDPARGTRHASAQRYSFDHPDTIVFVISRDGPVTVYADGDEITSIRMTTDDVQASG